MASFCGCPEQTPRNLQWYLWTWLLRQLEVFWHILKRLALSAGKNSSMKKKLKVPWHLIVLLVITIIALSWWFIIPVIGKTIKDMATDAKLPMLTERLSELAILVVSFAYNHSNILPEAFGYWSVILKPKRSRKIPISSSKFQLSVQLLCGNRPLYSNLLCSIGGRGCARLLDAPRAPSEMSPTKNFKEATRRVQTVKFYQNYRRAGRFYIRHSLIDICRWRNLTNRQFYADLWGRGRYSRLMEWALLLSQWWSLLYCYTCGG